LDEVVGRGDGNAAGRGHFWTPDGRHRGLGSVVLLLLVEIAIEVELDFVYLAVNAIRKHQQ